MLVIVEAYALMRIANLFLPQRKFKCHKTVIQAIRDIIKLLFLICFLITKPTPASHLPPLFLPHGGLKNTKATFLRPTQNGQKKTGAPRKRYKDSLEAHLKDFKIDVFTWEKAAFDRPA